MTNTNRKSHRIITVIAAGSIALGSTTVGFSSSIGRSAATSRTKGESLNMTRSAASFTSSRPSNQQTTQDKTMASYAGYVRG